VSELELQHALTVQKSVGGHLKLGSILMIGGVLSEHRLLRVLMDLHGVPAVSWRSLSEVSEETVRRLPLAEAVRWNAMPYAAHQQVIGVAFAKPSGAAVAEIAARTGLKVFQGVAPHVRIMQAHQRFYGLSIEEPIARLLAASDGSVATRLALEQLMLLSQGREGGQYPPTSPVADSLPTPTLVMRETADEASPRKKTLRDQAAEALAEFDSRSRAIFAAAEARETRPGAGVEVARSPAPPSEPAPEQQPPRIRRKTGFTTDDLRKLLTASASPAAQRSASRLKAGITAANLRDLIRF